MKKTLLTIIFLLLYSNLYSLRLYVDIDASGTGDGSSWVNAMNNLTDAIALTSSGDEVWVASGTYHPSSDYGLGGGSRFFHFRMVNGVEIYGGFAGTETLVSQRTDFGEGGANETILSGDLNDDDIANNLGTNKTDNTYHVFYHPNGTALISTAILDGFTIKGGYANGGGDHNSGGGIFNYDCDVSLNNIVFTNNRSQTTGGAIYNFASTVTISNSIFEYNYSQGGGAMYNRSSCSPSILNVIFRNNTTNGGTVYEFGGPTSNFTNVIFYRNSSTDGGGAYLTWGGNSTLNNCVFATNQANNVGGAGWIRSSTTTYNNCIFYNNNANNQGDQLYHFTDGHTILNFCRYPNGVNDIFITGAGSSNTTNNNITGDPLFVDAASDDYRLSFDSPCIDAGDNSYNTETYDIRGEDYSRKLGKLTGATGTIDMGAYEFRAGYDAAIISLSVSSILGESAIGNVILIADGVPSITSKGVIWSTSSTPTTSLTTKTNEGTGSDRFNSNITNLIPGTIYYARAYIVNSEGTSYSEEYVFETQTYEVSIDGNQDKVKDSEQDYIHTMLSTNGSNYMTVLSPSSYTVSDVSNYENEIDQEFSYPFGVTEFKINATEAEVKVYYHGVESLDGYVYRKLFPDGTYKEFDNVEFTSEIISGNRVAVAILTLTDGGPGDYDGEVNGVIYDPGGPALPITANIPYWSWWWLLLLIPPSLIIYKKIN